MQKMGSDARLLALDKDPQAILAAQDFAADGRFMIEQGTFATLRDYAGRCGLLGLVNGIVLDLGVSSPQLDDAGRGFSFSQDGPLDMRMNPDSGMSAAHWIATASESQITEVLKVYGEERYARRIACAIVAARLSAPITRTGELAAIVARANPAWEKGRDPATRSFQAIRIFINRELEDLQQFLDEVLDVLAPGGRLAVISFHSLEDRMVKRFIRKEARGDDFPPDLAVTQSELHPRVRAVGRAIHPGAAELADNPRARSAILRIAECLPASSKVSSKASDKSRGAGP